MIERVVRNDEVVGLIPICSTTFAKGRTEALGLSFYVLKPACPVRLNAVTELAPKLLLQRVNTGQKTALTPLT